MVSRESLAANSCFDPMEFIKLAHELAAHDGEQICVRTAVNRAYYGVFLAVRDKLNIKGTGPDIHQEVIRCFRAKHTSLGDQLDSMRKIRNTADYVLDGSQGLGYWNGQWKQIRPILLRLVRYLEQTD